MTILVVEDDGEYNKVLGEALHLYGHNVLSATNGNEAFETLQHSRVDLVISDIEMPTCSGTRLHEMVRHDLRLCMLPFVYITGYPVLRLATPLDDKNLDFMVSKVPFDRILETVNQIRSN